MDVRVPAALHHVPVGLVAVHRQQHATATAGDARVRQGGELLLEGGDPRERAPLGDVASVGERVDTDARHALVVGARDERTEMRDVAVHVAVAHEADQVERAAPRRGDDLTPGGPLPDRAAGESVLHELGALIHDASGAHGVVAHLGVAHVRVRGEPHGAPVRAEQAVRAGGEQAVEVGHARHRHGKICDAHT